MKTLAVRSIVAAASLAAGSLATSGAMAGVTATPCKHWDKIVFRITDGELARQVRLPKSTDLDIKVEDDPNQVADLKRKVLEFLNVPVTDENREDIKITDVEYAIQCDDEGVTTTVTTATIDLSATTSP